MATLGRIAQTGRKLRKPVHRFNVRYMPFQIQPFLIAPVIPGETLKAGQLQARVVTDPIRNGLIGWWNEYYFFYVKLRDLDQRDLLTGLMLDPDEDLTSLEAAAAVKYNHHAGSPDFASMCTTRIVETYFRNEGELAGDYLIDGMPAAAINAEGWWQSAVLGDTYNLADFSADLDADTVVEAGEIDQALRMYQFQRAHNMTEMTYEDWLATYGVRTPRVELHRPELLRYIREWQYPSNTIDPADGSPSSAVSWAIRDRIDKDRFFDEPGFIVGVTVARPKVYMKNIDGNAVDTMRTALAWLPALMRDDPWTSMVKLPETEGPLATIVADAEGYWFDVKDLLLYGDDFINFARTATDANLVALPDATLSNKDYPSKTDTDALFVAVADTGRLVRADGIVNLEILGAQWDTTPPPSRGD